MLTIKKSQFNQQPDFRDVGVRRLMGALEDTRQYASLAMQRLDQRYDVGMEEIQSDPELVYWLHAIFGNDWQEILNG